MSRLGERSDGTDADFAATRLTAPAYPQLRLNSAALENNIRVMAAWCRDRGVELAPHVKTTMSAPIIERQLAAGAVGVTVATVDQVASALRWGHQRVLVANEIVDRSGLTRVRAWLEEDPAREIRCFVDSAAGVKVASGIFDGAAADLEVLIDVGTPGGRTGIRSLSEGLRLAGLVRATPGLRLVGVAGYEGVVPNSRAEDTVTAVDRHCRLVRDVYLEAAEFFETATPIYSMGGSAFPDRVVEFLPDRGQVPGTRILLRSGCYVTHDHGTYAAVSPVPGLIPALSVRAIVLSTPEAGYGRRRCRQTGPSLRRRTAQRPLGPDRGRSPEARRNRSGAQSLRPSRGAHRGVRGGCHRYGGFRDFPSLLRV